MNSQQAAQAHHGLLTVLAVVLGLLAPATALTQNQEVVPWRCSATGDDVCHFTIYLTSGGFRNFTMRAGEQDLIPNVWPGRDTYCARLNAVPDASTCQRRQIRRDLNQ